MKKLKISTHLSVAIIFALFGLAGCTNSGGSSNDSITKPSQPVVTTYPLTPVFSTLLNPQSILMDLTGCTDAKGNSVDVTYCQALNPQPPVNANVACSKDSGVAASIVSNVLNNTFSTAYSSLALPGLASEISYISQNLLSLEVNSCLKTGKDPVGCKLKTDPIDALGCIARAQISDPIDYRSPLVSMCGITPGQVSTYSDTLAFTAAETVQGSYIATGGPQTLSDGIGGLQATACPLLSANQPNPYAPTKTPLTEVEAKLWLESSYSLLQSNSADWAKYTSPYVCDSSGCSGGTALGFPIFNLVGGPNIFQEIPGSFSVATDGSNCSAMLVQDPNAPGDGYTFPPVVIIFTSSF